MSWYPCAGRATHVIARRWEPCVEGLFADAICGQNIRLVGDLPLEEDEHSCRNCQRVIRAATGTVTLSSGGKLIGGPWPITLVGEDIQLQTTRIQDSPVRLAVPSRKPIDMKTKKKIKKTRAPKVTTKTVVLEVETAATVEEVKELIKGALSREAPEIQVCQVTVQVADRTK